MKDKKRQYNFKNLTGQKFNQLVVIGLDTISNGRTRWLCRCDCGNEKSIVASDLKSGNTKSCGCFALKIRTKHGHLVGGKYNFTYSSWQHMLSRCINSNNDAYQDYGGRGIIIDPRWIESFENFYTDMGPRPKNTSIDRINVDGNYELDNCKWATKKEQQRNTRCSTNSFDYDGHVYWRDKLRKVITKIIRKQTKYFKVFEKYVGCTPEEFQKYIESQFEPGMSWDNYGRGKNRWSIDHIKGCNNFDLSKEEDRLRCFNYKNLRPLDNIENSKKQRRELIPA